MLTAQFSEDPAFQLFCQEYQELMAHVGKALAALIKAPSLIEFQRLRRSVRLIHQGAVQMELGELTQYTSRLLVLLQAEVPSAGEQFSVEYLEQLTQVFNELQSATLSVSSFPAGPVDASGENVALNETPQTRQLETAIAHLEQSLATQSGSSLIAEVKAEVEALSLRATAWHWDALEELITTLLQGIKTHPNATVSLTAVGILGLKALQHSTFTVEQSPNNYEFQTAQNFIWQSQHTIHVIKSSAIVETLIPRASQIISQADQQQLQWQNQSLPIVNLSEKLMPHLPQVTGRHYIEPDVTQTLTSQLMLVIDTVAEMIALAIEPDQFIQLPVLTITPMPQFPSFYLGKTSLEQEADLPILDVVAFLNQEIERASPFVDHENSRPAIALPASQTSTSSPHVLVVDDSRTIRYLLKRLFERSGYQVTLAADGLEALDQLQDCSDIELLVTDVEMPNLTGLELLDRCRNHQQWKTLPILVLSQCPTDQDHRLSQQFGADAYLPKPFTHEVFLKTVQALLHPQS